VIALIRAAKNPVEAREGLITQFSLSNSGRRFSNMQLQRLTGPSARRSSTKLAESLESDRATACDPLKRQAGDARSSSTSSSACARSTATTAAPRSSRKKASSAARDLIVEEDMAITVSKHRLQIKRTAESRATAASAAAARGASALRTREEDFVSHLFVASTHAYIMIFSDRGRAYWLKVYKIPDVGPDGRGKAIANLVSMEEGERHRLDDRRQGIRG